MRTNPHTTALAKRPRYKATRAEIILRVREVRRKILHGVDRDAIVQYCQDTWFITPSQAVIYLDRAWQSIWEYDKIGRDHQMQYHLRLRQELREDAYAKGDYRFALEVAKDECELLGLYPTKRGQPIEQQPTSVTIILNDSGMTISSLPVGAFGSGQQALTAPVAPDQAHSAVIEGRSRLVERLADADAAADEPALANDPEA